MSPGTATSLIETFPSINMITLSKRRRFHMKILFSIAPGFRQKPGMEQRLLATILAKYKLTLPATVIAKIDIEGDEWDVLNNASIETLSMFSQLICEFHSFEQMVDDEFFQRAVQVFLKLGEVFEPIHVHGNNYSPLLIVGNKLFPDVLEVTFANRSIYAFDKNKEIFPGPLDAPNNPRVEDYHLGFFKY